MDTKTMLHHLRNPYSIDEIEMRKARLQAADELERLYKFEKELKTYIDSLCIREAELLNLETQLKDIDALKSNKEDSLKGFLRLKEKRNA